MENQSKNASGSTSWPSGTQVDGSPLVVSTKTVLKRKSRVQRKSMILAQKIKGFDIFQQLTAA
mgnify:CR=1 FL=1